MTDQPGASWQLWIIFSLILLPYILQIKDSHGNTPLGLLTESGSPWAERLWFGVVMLLLGMAAGLIPLTLYILLIHVRVTWEGSLL